MSRYRGATCRRCRRVQMSVCGSKNCAFLSRAYPPGQHGLTGRGSMSDYKIRLIEKQRLRYLYEIQEKQFRRYVEKAKRKKGITGENLLKMLECRLDNIVYRLGFAPTIRAARQLVSHGHFLLNDKKVNIPSIILKPGDTVRVRDKSKNLKVINESLNEARSKELPPYLEIDPEKLMGRLAREPERDQIPVTIRENLIIEFYSR